MKKVLDELCDYRRYCWNKGLETWNDLYESRLLMLSDDLRQKVKDKCINKKKISLTDDEKTLLKQYPSPNQQLVRNILVDDKQDWQYELSARTLQLAIADLGKAFDNFFNKALPDWGKPEFKSKKNARQGFKTDRAKVVNGKLRLDKPRDTTHIWSDISIKGLKSTQGVLTTVSIYRENGKYYASLLFKDVTVSEKAKTNVNTAVDVNVGHINYTNGKINTLPKRLDRRYKRIKHYQRLLARKRNTNGKNASQSNNYVETRTKLQREYAKVSNIQHDIIQKLTTKLVTDYDKIVIEDLDVKKMQMTHVASKGLQRSMFGYFRQVLTYKCQWYGKELILADRFYPSTQRCSSCGHVKKGDERITLNGNKKHNTKHNEYICYECGAILDRDENAVMNLIALAQE